jgi:cytochrome c peroxidase
MDASGAWRPKLALAAAATLLAIAIVAARDTAGDALDESAPTAFSLGEKIFADPSLSASGRMSCATCHDPAHAHAQSNDLSVQLGGAGLDVAGTRAVPSLRYLSFTPRFSLDDGPVGGFNRDGRADTLMIQAMRPLLSPNEMANASVEELIRRLAATPYADEFRQVFGDDIFGNPEGAFQALLFALQQYQTLDPDFRPFNSKYDSFLRGHAQLAPAELRGLALFNSPAKGNCAACHPSHRGPNGELPLFTDFTYDNLGVPRNEEIAANADPAYFDLGLCGPSRTDLADQADLCGAFKVPTLRNVATRHVFFHNGRFRTLRDALRFYVQRDTSPELFYPVNEDGTVLKLDDLPQEYRGNVNTEEVPYDRVPGEAPRLSEAELADLESFLNTLTDGYDPAAGPTGP